MNSGSVSPAGWYPDAEVDGGLRWWDGSTWTEHRQTAINLSNPSLPPESVPAVDPLPTRASLRGARLAYEIPAAGHPNVDVSGESWREAELQRAIGRQLQVDEEVEVYKKATLVPEPDNPFDPNAISLRIDGHVVGYVPRDETMKYLPAVNRITASGHTASTTARVWAVKRRTYDGEIRLNSNIRFAAAWNGIALPLNNPPEVSYSMLPWGGIVQVSGEENHFAHLKNYLPKSGVGVLIVTIHRTERSLKSGQPREIVEVRLDGEPVGELSSTTSRHYLPTIDHHSERAVTVASWATIQGSPLSAEVKLQGAKASELTPEWLEGPPTTVGKLIAEAPGYDIPDAYIPQEKPETQATATRPSAAAPTLVPASSPKGGCVVVFLAGFSALAAGGVGVVNLFF